MVITILVWPRSVDGQSDRELAASDAMLVAPMVAFVPGIASPERTLTLRYGAWAYHQNEPLRSSVAVTFGDSIRIGAVALTVGYISPACKGCDASAVTLAEWERPLVSLLGLRLGAGFGRMMGNKGSGASFSASLPLTWRGQGAALLIHPTVIVAGLESTRSQSRAVRPGLAAALQFEGERLVGQAGAQAIALRGTGISFGGGLGWRL